MLSIKFEIVTPERVVLKEEVIQVTVPTKMGEITVLPNHIPLVAPLLPGVVEVIKIDGERDTISLSGGFIEVLHGKVVLLADTAERAHEIDENKAEEAKRRAEEMMKNMERFDQEQFTDVSAKIAKELARIKAVRRWRNLRKMD